MDDLAYGTRNKRGDYSPKEPLKLAPYFTFPPSRSALLKWLPSYFLPWNVPFMALGALMWFVLTPSVETMKTLAPGWILYLFALNALTVLIVYGALELRLYVKRAQGGRFKFNGLWPSERPSDVFMFRSQNVDNIIRTFATGVPVWTAYQ